MDRFQKFYKRVQAKWMDKIRFDCASHHSNAPIWIDILHNTIMFDNFWTTEDTLKHLWKEDGRHQDIPNSALYNLRMKESDSVHAYLNEYESLNSQIAAHVTTTEDELKAMLLMSSFPPSWETAIKYSSITSAILTEATRRKSFVNDSAKDAYYVQGSTNRSNNCGRDSSR